MWMRNLSLAWWNSVDYWPAFVFATMCQRISVRSIIRFIFIFVARRQAWSRTLPFDSTYSFMHLAYSVDSIRPGREMKNEPLPEPAAEASPTHTKAQRLDVWLCESFTGWPWSEAQIRQIDATEERTHAGKMLEKTTNMRNSLKFSSFQFAWSYYWFFLSIENEQMTDP